MAGVFQIKRTFASVTRSEGVFSAIREIYDNLKTLLGIVPVGSVMLWPHTGDEPSGWLELRGQAVRIGDYPQLYKLYGTSFGGDGTGYFVLPDWRSIYIAGSGTSGDTQAGMNYTLTVGTTGSPISLTVRLTRFIVRAG